jgi:hypothetical protein
VIGAVQDQDQAMASAFTLQADGDPFEKRYAAIFIADRFPSYESFWRERVVPLTNRVTNRGDIRFRSKPDLLADGYTDEDVTVAQLHYTLLLHLGRVLELLADAADRAPSPQPWDEPPFNRYAFFEAFTRLSGVSDLADELLARHASPGKYPAWNEKAGANARRDWRKGNPDPLEPIRSYRNRLVHGRVVPELIATAFSASETIEGLRLFYPRLNRVDDYLDWRNAFAATGITAVPGPGSAVAITTPPADFEDASVIVGEAWEQTIAHVEASWRSHLLAGT